MPNAIHNAIPARTYRPVAQLLSTYRTRHPDKAAIVDVDRRQQITYRELAANVDGIALQLLSMGIGKGSRVVLLGDNSISKVVIWLGIWKVGGVACPLDLPFIRTAALTTLQAINPALVIADQQQYGTAILEGVDAPIIWFADDLPGGGVTLMGIKKHFRRTGSSAATGKPPPPAMTDLACLSCTSGTTGLPKIVAYDHLALWENGLDSIALLGLSENDRTLEYRSLGWYSSQILSLIPFLQTGLTLHLARKFSYSHIADWIEDYRITVCVGVPTVAHILVNDPVPDATERFASLRLMTSSTAPLATALWRGFERAYGIRLLNLYGSTETGWISGNRLGARRIGTVGRTLPDVSLAILSDSGEPCPPGVAGQVVVSADKLALGYLQQDGSLTAIRGKPFTMRDIAAKDKQGYIRILGRTDDLINRGGVKISPMEIEDVVLAHRDVQEAAAIGVPDPFYGEQPVCFIVPRANAAADAADILAHCAARLPREKVPVQIILIAALPRSGRGKLLRAKLLENYQAAILFPTLKLFC